jgi:hypothetical protein
MTLQPQDHGDNTYFRFDFTRYGQGEDRKLSQKVVERDSTSISDQGFSNCSTIRHEPCTTESPPYVFIHLQVRFNAPIKYSFGPATAMTGTHSVPWKKLDPQELRQKLMGYGEHTMNHEEPKVKLSGKGIFQ